MRKGSGMKRRSFIYRVLHTIVISSSSSLLLSASKSQATGRTNTTNNIPGSLKSFAFYQGLGETELRDPSRIDGTYYNMPCINPEDISSDQGKVYNFWHGHRSQQHQFLLTIEDLEALREHGSVEVYTNIIDGHRHALKITSGDYCD